MTRCAVGAGLVRRRRRVPSIPSPRLVALREVEPLRIAIERDLGASPAVVWRHLTEPSLMNEWSRAAIEGVVPGEHGSFGSAGARRRVRLPFPARAVLLDEVVDEAAPPLALRYRVVGRHRLLRQHAGELRLEPTDGGCRLCWTVEARFAVPMLGPAIGRFLHRELGRSLDTLASLVVAGPAAGRRR